MEAPIEEPALGLNSRLPLMFKKLESSNHKQTSVDTVCHFPQFSSAIQHRNHNFSMRMPLGDRMEGFSNPFICERQRRGLVQLNLQFFLFHPRKDFLAALRESLPDSVELVAHETHAEDPAFVRAAVARLIELIEQEPAAG